MSSPPGRPTELDRDKLNQTTFLVFGALSGAVTSAMIHLGDRLGLFRALAGAGPQTSHQLAKATDLHERWVREWMQQLGAARILDYVGDGAFELAAEAACVLADEEHPGFGCGPFAALPSNIGVLDRIAESFRTGLGLPYDAFGREGAVGIERGFAPWFRSQLVPRALPKVPGVCEALERGGEAADVGCGSGVALIEMAKAFPASRFHGYDISCHALERARSKVAEAGLTNVELHDPSREPLPTTPRFDLVTTFDCLHDMTDPAAVIRQIRASLHPDGHWLICDIKAHPTYEENTQRNPMAALMYGFSVLSCMSSALSEPGGAGLGTLGLHADLARELAEEAGFGRFERLDIEHPINAFYVARP